MSAAILHYDAPAHEWSQALPVGNGRLGAMVHGRTTTELLQLNEDSVWYGGPQSRTPQDALKHLDRLRQLIRSGQHANAEKLVKQAFFATPHSQRHYEPLGTFTIELGHEEEEVKNYRRWLDLETAVTSVRYQHRGVEYSRDVYASYPDNVIVIELQSSEMTEFTLRLTRTSEIEYETNEFVDSIVAEHGTITMQATPGGRESNPLACVVKVQCAGTVDAVGNCLVVNSSRAIIVISAQTKFRYNDIKAVALKDARRALSGIDLRSRHVEDYKSLYGRLRLRLASSKSQETLDSNLSPSPSETHAVPTHKRLLEAPHPSLIALYHNYGRYLLISCSRPGFKALPATLQGIWNPSFQPAWGSKYTININTQMNYWPANVCNLVECEDPLFDLLERMAKRGVSTARTMYGCRGWCCHHNTDIFADTDPQDRWMPSTSE